MESEPENDSAKKEGNSGEEEEEVEPDKDAIFYIPWEDACRFLKKGRDSLQAEYRLIEKRAKIEKQYADSLASWAGEVRTQLRGTDSIEYGKLHDALWDLADEASLTRRHQERVADSLQGAGSAAQELRRFKSKAHHKNRLSIITKSTDEIDSFHHLHRSIFERFLKLVTTTNELSTKYKKAARKAFEARAKLKHSRNLKGVGGDLWRQRLKNQESEVLNIESAANCLGTQYHRNVKNLQHDVAIVSREAANFKLQLMDAERERLACVVEQLTSYVNCLHLTSEERKAQNALKHQILDNLAQLKPGDSVKEWTDVHSHTVELPKILNEYAPTSVLTSNVRNAYGHREGVAQLFQADSLKETDKRVKRSLSPRLPRNRRLAVHRSPQPSPPVPARPDSTLHTSYTSTDSSPPTPVVDNKLGDVSDTCSDGTPTKILKSQQKDLQQDGSVMFKGKERHTTDTNYPEVGRSSRNRLQGGPLSHEPVENIPCRVNDLGGDLPQTKIAWDLDYEDLDDEDC